MTKKLDFNGAQTDYECMSDGVFLLQGLVMGCNGLG